MTTPEASTFLTFDDFLDLEDEPNLYELHDGRPVEMPEPDQRHEDILEFLSFEFGVALRYAGLHGRYAVRLRNALKIGKATGRRPDLAIVKRPGLDLPSVGSGRGIVTPELIVEVASGNWQNDISKIREYEAIGVTELWIVDYAGYIPVEHCQREVGPKVMVFILGLDDKYQHKEYIGDEPIVSFQFPAIELTAKRVLNGGEE